MNDTLKNISERRSCRKFRKDQILDRELDEILRAGMNAPTGGNRQPALMVVIRDEELIRKLSAMNAAVMGKEGIDPFYGAPALVTVFSDTASATYKEDGALVLGNLMNAAYAQGVGSCWIHRAKEMFESEEGKALKKEWGIPESYVGVGNCILGYPDQKYREIKHRDDYIRFV